MQHYTQKNVMPMHSLGHLLIRARNLMTDRWLGLSRMLISLACIWGVLIAMHRGVAYTPAELSKMVSVDAELMTRTLEKLETKRRLERSRSPDDCQVVSPAPTKIGEDAAGLLPNIAEEVPNPRLRKFATTEVDELCRLLQKFIEQ